MSRPRRGPEGRLEYRKGAARGVRLGLDQSEGQKARVLSYMCMSKAIAVPNPMPQQAARAVAAISLAETLPCKPAMIASNNAAFLRLPGPACNKHSAALLRRCL